MLSKIWEWNRWYDDLAETNSTERFLIFISVFSVILFIPLFGLLIFGSTWVGFEIIKWGLMLFVGVMRIWWLRKNKAL